MTDHNNWTTQDRPMHLLTILKREATNDLCSVPAIAPYNDKVKVLLGHYKYHQIDDISFPTEGQGPADQ
jgi:hypothetical protein